MSIIEEIGGIILSPQKTLESISEKEDITSAFIIVLIASILTSISGIYGILSPDMRVMLEMYEIEITTTMLIILFAVGLISGLIGWAIQAGIYRLVSMLFGGTGNYKKILQLLGYAYAMHFIFIPVYMLVMMALPILSIPISLIGLIWAVILTVFSIKAAEDISLIKAFLVGVISFIILIVLLVIVYFIIVFIAVMFLFM